MKKIFALIFASKPSPFMNKCTVDACRCLLGLDTLYAKDDRGTSKERDRRTKLLSYSVKTGGYRRSRAGGWHKGAWHDRSQPGTM